jgi:membrane protease YdiL (CAAX protease family)
VAWLLVGIGVVLLFVATQSTPPLSAVLLVGALLLMTFGLVSAAGYQVVARGLRPAGWFRGPSPLILFGIQLVIVNVVSGVLLVLGVPLEGSGGAFLVASVVLLVGYLAVVWLFGFKSGALDLHGICLSVGASFGRIATDVGLGAITMVVVALLDAVWGSVLGALLNTTTPDVLPPPTGVFNALTVLIGACLLIPVGEELFFRGYSLTAWLRDRGPRSALIRSTVFFALVHVANIVVEPSMNGAVEGLKQAVLEVLVIAPVGLALGWLFIRRGLVASIAGHAAFNLFGVLTLILVQAAVQ